MTKMTKIDDDFDHFLFLYHVFRLIVTGIRILQVSGFGHFPKMPDTGY